MSYLSALLDAWRQRESLGSRHHSRELAAFLPAALEIQEAPQNPIARWLGRSLIVLFILIVLWACIGEVNIVASAEGKIIPSSRVKQIQPLEKAVVKKILVTEGQSVIKGQPLVELDSTLTKADQRRIASELYRTQLNLSVSQGLLELLEQFQPQEKVPAHNNRITKPQVIHYESLKLPNITELMQAHISKSDRHLHKQLLWQQWQQYLTQYQALKNTQKKTRAEQGVTQEIIKKLQQTLPIIRQRTKKLQQLLAKNFASEDEYLLLKQEAIEKAQDLAAEKQRLKQLEAAEGEVQQQLHTLVAQTRAEALGQMSLLQSQIATLQQELTKAHDIHAKQILYAPVDGEVQQLVLTTVGGVVTEAQELMRIVPNAEQLEVEVFLQNTDIGFVRENMQAEIKVHTFPFTKYGIIDAEVTHVSDDAILDEQRGLIYSMHLVMKKNTVMVNGKAVQLIPGMAVTAEVKTGHRRIVEFFMAPLLRYSQEGLRER